MGCTVPIQALFRSNHSTMYPGFRTSISASFLSRICMWWTLWAKKTGLKVLQSGLYWPTLFKDAYNFCKACDRCQRTGNLSSKNQMPLQNILVVEIFDMRCIDFMGPFPPSSGCVYILLAVDYLCKWL